MFCKNCGKELNENIPFCMGCGCATPGHEKNRPSAAQADCLSVCNGVICYFFWLIGLFLTIGADKNRPLYQKSCMIGTVAGIISFAAGVILFLLFGLLWDHLIF